MNELDINKLTGEEKLEIRDQVKAFHRYNDVIRQEDYYRLAEKEGIYNSWSFVSKDKKCVLVEYVQIKVETNKPGRRIKLKGLNKESKYSVPMGR